MYLSSLAFCHAGFCYFTQNNNNFKGRNVINLSFIYLFSDNLLYKRSVDPTEQYIQIWSQLDYFYLFNKDFILMQKRCVIFFIHSLLLKSNGDILAPSTPLNTGPPDNENSIFYLFCESGLNLQSRLIFPHQLIIFKRSKCPQFAKKAVDIYELVQLQGGSRTWLGF